MSIILKSLSVSSEGLKNKIIQENNTIEKLEKKKLCSL